MPPGDLVSKNYIRVILQLMKTDGGHQEMLRIVESLSGSEKKTKLHLSGSYSGWFIDPRMREWSLENIARRDPNVAISLLEFVSSCDWMEPASSVHIRENIRRCIDAIRSGNSRFVRSCALKFFEFFAFQKRGYDFEFSTVDGERKEYSSLRDRPYNTNVVFYYPPEEIVDDGGNGQVAEGDYFRHKGKILCAWKVEYCGNVFFAATIRHHKRIGFFKFSLFEGAGVSANVMSLLPDLELVEMEGTSIKTVDMKMVKRHVFLMKVQKPRNFSYEVFELRRSTNSIGSEGQAVNRRSDPFRCVVQFPDGVQANDVFDL